MIKVYAVNGRYIMLFVKKQPVTGLLTD